jgi:uncharacterized protein YjbI with pentapeptide repeats
LTEAYFYDTDFSGANLTGANLSGDHDVSDFVNFQGANLTDANLNSEDLKGCDFYEAIYNENTQFPPEVDPELAVAKKF